MSLPGLALIFAWIAVLILLSRLIDHMLRRVFRSLGYLLIVSPGVAVHELSHAVGCLLTGARIAEIRLFSRQGGYVKHSRPRIPVIGPVVISLAPLFGGVIVIYAIAYFMDYSGIGLLDLGSPETAFGRFFSFFGDNWMKWHFWVFVYFLISIAASLGPSNQDLKNASVGLVIIAFILGLLIMASATAGDWLDVILSPLLAGLNLALFLIVIALIVVIPFYLMKK